MLSYRIYALIHGETLTEGKIFGCEIRKMDLKEQVKRKFSPIQSVFSEREYAGYYKTYVTFLPYVDPVRIKSEHVIICDIEEDRPGGALGGAINTIDRICRFLTLACLEDVKRKFGKDIGNFEPYIYQVNKMYTLDAGGKEIEVDFQLESGHIYLPNRPEFDKWREPTTEKFLNEVYNFYDQTLERALKYLYRSSIGYFLLDSPEKIALDHFKSVEIIIDSLSKKRTFKERLVEAAAKIGITSDERGHIEYLWGVRSRYGDVAHPSPFDESGRYPNQFPVPSNVRYSGRGSIAANIILKYFRYIKGVFVIDIDEPDDASKEDTFARVFTLFPFGTNDRNHLCFYTAEKDKNRLKSKLRKSFAKYYKIPEKSIAEMILKPTNKKGTRQRTFKLRVDTTE